MRSTLVRQVKCLAIGPSAPRTSLLLHVKVSQRPPRRETAALFSLLGRRFYSLSTQDPADNQAAADHQAEQISRAKDEAAAQSATSRLQADLEAKVTEVVDLKDKYLRSVADFRNLQERTKRDIQAARDFAITKFAKDLIESVDNLDRALTTVPEDKLKQEGADDLKNLHDGLRMTERILMSTVAKHGLERFDPSETGEKFDPNKHEAQFMTKMEGKEDGTTFGTISKGFSLNGRIIRAAKVGVVKNS